MPVSQRSIVLPDGVHPALLYEPSGARGRTIITFSGFSIHGYQDKRLAAVSQAFARQGFRVVTPCVADIDQLLIHPSSIDKFAALIQAIYVDNDLNPAGKPLGIFAASYSGGVAMLAAARTAIAPCVKAICLIGAFSHFKNVLRFVIEQRGVDEYARYILLRNFLQQSRFHDGEIVELLNIAIQDNGFKRKKPLLPERLRVTSPGTVDFFKRLLQDTAFRSELSYKAFEEINRRECWEDHFNLANKLAEANFAVSLIHGYGDRVIPSDESVYLHETLQRLGKHSHLTLTKLLNHGDVILSRELGGELNKLASGFGFFIGSLHATHFH